MVWKAAGLIIQLELAIHGGYLHMEPSNHPFIVKTIMVASVETMGNHNINPVQEPAMASIRKNLRQKHIGHLHPSEETSRIRIAFGQ